MPPKRRRVVLTSESSAAQSVATVAASATASGAVPSHTATDSSSSMTVASPQLPPGTPHATASCPNADTNPKAKAPVTAPWMLHTLLCDNDDWQGGALVELPLGHSVCIGRTCGPDSITQQLGAAISRRHVMLEARHCGVFVTALASNAMRVRPANPELPALVLTRNDTAQLGHGCTLDLCYNRMLQAPSFSLVVARADWLEEDHGDAAASGIAVREGSQRRPDRAASMASGDAKGVRGGASGTDGGGDREAVAGERGEESDGNTSDTVEGQDVVPQGAGGRAAHNEQEPHDEGDYGSDDNRDDLGDQGDSLHTEARRRAPSFSDLLSDTESPVISLSYSSGLDTPVGSKRGRQ